VWFLVAVIALVISARDDAALEDLMKKAEASVKDGGDGGGSHDTTPLYVKPLVKPERRLGVFAGGTRGPNV
jgi:hypothetical protein